MRDEKLEAVAPSADDAQALERLWNRCHETGEHGAAIEALRSAIAADGTVARHHYMLGCTLQDAGRIPEAMQAYRRALALQPGLARAQNNLGCLLEGAGEAEAAMRCYEAALRAEPGLAHALYNRGNMHKLRGNAAQAEADIARALEIEPRHPDWRCVLGEVFVVQWKLDAAQSSYRAVLEIDPTDVRARFGLANALLMAGRADEAEEWFRGILADQPGLASAHSNLLLCLHYRKGNDGRALHEEHLAWSKRHAGGLRGGAAHLDRNPEKRLNIGYVSPNFHAHPVASFIEPLLRSHDRGGFRVFCYSDVPFPDAVTQRLKGLCDVWRDIHGLSHDEAARLIQQDRIDILVDLAGHTGGTRLLLFARKPAPVQVTWLGYPDTTGLAEIDYRITDAVADPEGEADARHSEKLVRLESGFLCFAPHDDSPPVGKLPALESGHVTFGSFNNLAKVTPGMVGLWAEILAAVPDARLIMKAHALGSEDARRALLGLFADRGIGAERVDLRGAEDSARGHLALYGAVDIALDTFPYNGTTTTCEALWMGVPVVSLSGKTHASRVGASILTRAGLPDLAASHPEEYVRKAVAFAADLPRLRDLRHAMRDRLRASPLLDAGGFARSLEASLRQMWRTWCAATPAKPAPPVRAAAGGGHAARVLLDAVYFQYHETGIARVWRSLMQEWMASGYAQNLLLLDRDGTAPEFPGVRRRRVARHSYQGLAEDREMLQQVCDDEGAAAFVSTYYTSPLATPSVMMVWDMIPEVLGANLNEPTWREKEACIRSADRYVAISYSTAQDLRKYYPDVRPGRITVAHCGVNPLFKPAGRAEVESFRARHGIARPYFLLVGARASYKNAATFFSAFSKLRGRDRFAVVCVGGEPDPEPELRALREGSERHMLRLDDEELRLAYCGATALVYPSAYEGFGMPVVEAMASGCPVITTSNASLPEVAGDAAIFVRPLDSAALTDALEKIQDAGLRDRLIAKGIERAAMFSWARMAQSVARVLAEVAAESAARRASNGA
jgi:protein O-GlcNAc transferase